MKQTLLIEIGVEEIPASYLKPAVEQLTTALAGIFEAAHISYGAVERYFTPRRLCAIFRDTDEQGKEKVEKIYGPPEKQGFDEQGNPTKAALGFSKSMGKKVSEIKIGERKGKRVCYIEKEEKPKLTRELVKSSLKEILSKLYFPKKMKWEDTGFEFARPIRWMVVLLGKKVIRVKLAGICSSNVSFGPRFSGAKEIKIEDAANYEKIMERNYVMVSFEKRRKKIESEAQSLLGGSMYISEDTALLDEVANLVEYPMAFKGSFDESFLEMPKDVLATAMKEHQRYFAVFDSKGRIKPIYIGIANTLKRHMDKIAEGHNSVLRARLSDAKFYWDEDLKVQFADRIQELKGVEWHVGLGTVYDKSIRLVELSKMLCRECGEGRMDILERGAMLAKGDVVTNMIKDGKEFTTLEGIIGKEYALRSKEKEDVAEIIAQHHLPRSPEDDLPKLHEASIVGIADRIDTLVGNFLIGEVPTGSFDPFGLRRCANGLLRIVDSSSMRFNLENIINKSIALFLAQEGIAVKLEKKETITRLIDFLEARIASYLGQKGVRYDIAASVLAVPYDELFDIIERSCCLDNEREDPGFAELVIGQRRVRNILQGIRKDAAAVDAGLFDCEAEKKLWSKFESTKGAFGEHMSGHAYKKALCCLFGLRSHIDDFFDDCLVMDKDEKKRNNRIGMLLNIKNLYDEYADFSLIVLEGEREQKSRQ